MVAGAGRDVRIALMGVGRIGVGHAEALADVEGVALTLCDADPARAQQVQQRLRLERGAAASVSTAQEVLAHPEDYDGVVIATPTATHEELVLGAARAGLPFFCEKPVKKKNIDEGD